MNYIFFEKSLTALLSFFFLLSLIYPTIYLSPLSLVSLAEITIRVDESECLSMASSHDQETERFLSTGTTGRRVSFNEAALFDHGKKAQEKGRRSDRSPLFQTSNLFIQCSTCINVQKLHLSEKDIYILLCLSHFYVSLGLRINKDCIMYAVDTQSSHLFLLFSCLTFLFKS